MIENSIMGFFILRRKRRRTMKTRANILRFPRLRRARRNPVKLTALLYLREALLEERYEDCAQIIAIAREFGAQILEIQDLLEDPRRHP